MSIIKLTKLILNEATKPDECGSNTANSCTQNAYNTTYNDPKYHRWTEGTGGMTAYFYCLKKTSGVVSSGGGSSDDCVTGKVCPETDGYKTLEFQEWVWTTYNKFAATGTQKSRLCGLTTSPGCKATSCTKSKAVDGSCGNGTKAVWADLKNDFIAFKNASSSNVTQDDNQQQNQIQTVVVDPDLRELKKDMEIYRNILDSFDLPTGWQLLDTLEPDTFVPVSLNIDLITNIKNQIVEYIEDKGRSAEFNTFIKMLRSLSNAYNNEKYKEFFQNEVDPEGDDVFVTFESYIEEIEDAATKKEEYNYDPLTDPTQEQVRDIIFRYVPKTVYNVGKVVLQMGVYFYTGEEPLKGTEEGLVDILTDRLETTKENVNFENCKNLLAIYYESYQKTKIETDTLLGTKKQIQDCWCKGLYDDLGKLGVKNLFDKDMRKGRKELIRFLNILPSSAMGDFRVTLNRSICVTPRTFK